jgi:hypothetical protein
VTSAVALFRMLTPTPVPDLPLVRLGSPNEGGYVVPDWPPFYRAGLLSYGVGGNPDFENDVLRRFRTTVVAFDPTVRRPETMDGDIRFVPHGLGPADEGVYGRLDSHRGFLGAGPVMVKIDTEGAEWRSLAALGDLDELGVTVLVIELHDILRPSDLKVAVVRKLAAWGHVAHIHGNNFNPFVHRLTPSPVMEVTFVSKGAAAAHGFVPVGVTGLPLAEHPYPVAGLDAPNDPALPDLPLDWWL